MIPLETHEQQKLVNWMNMKGIVFTAIPNGARTNITQAIKLKKEGMQKGFPDLLIFGQETRLPKNLAFGFSIKQVRNDFIKGVAIEMKRKKGGVQSKEQKEWQKKLENFGWIYILAHGYEEAKKQLEELGY